MSESKVGSRVLFWEVIWLLFIGYLVSVHLLEKWGQSENVIVL